MSSVAAVYDLWCTGPVILRIKETKYTPFLKSRLIIWATNPSLGTYGIESRISADFCFWRVFHLFN
jgi:hypothetical protein